MDNDVHKGSLLHAESLGPQFVIPNVQDNQLPPVLLVGSEPMINHMKVVPEHPNVHGSLGGLVLVCHFKVIGPDAWWVHDVVAGPVQVGWLLGQGKEATSHGY